MNQPAGTPTQRRRGFAMVLLAVAAASVATVTVATQNTGSAYTQANVTQLQRNSQSRWIAESFNELGIAAQCAPSATPLFPASWAYKPYQLGFTAGPQANLSAPEVIAVRTSPSFGLLGLLSFSQDIQVRLYSDITMATRPLVERELNVRNVKLQTDILGTHIATSHNRLKKAWVSRDANALP